MDFTVADVRAVVLFAMLNTGNPETLRSAWPDAWDRPFLANSEMTAPVEELLAWAISLAAANTASSMSRVVLMHAS